MRAWRRHLLSCTTTQFTVCYKENKTRELEPFRYSERKMICPFAMLKKMVTCARTLPYSLLSDFGFLRAVKKKPFQILEGSEYYFFVLFSGSNEVQKEFRE